MAKKRKTPKRTIKRAHSIARKIMASRSGSKPRNPWAVGMAVAKKTARRKRKSSRR